MTERAHHLLRPAGACEVLADEIRDVFGRLPMPPNPVCVDHGFGLSSFTGELPGLAMLASRSTPGRCRSSCRRPAAPILRLRMRDSRPCRRSSNSPDGCSCPPTCLRSCLCILPCPRSFLMFLIYLLRVYSWGRCSRMPPVCGRRLGTPCKVRCEYCPC